MIVYTDEYDSYNGLERTSFTTWKGLRYFLRPVRGVHKKYLLGYVAVYECRVNFKLVSPTLISALVKVHSFRVEPFLFLFYAKVGLLNFRVFH